MMPAITAFDVALLAVFVLALVIDWQQGVVSPIMAILGVVLGLVTGVPLAPLAMAQVENQSGKVSLGPGAVILLASIDHVVGTVTRRSLRNTIRSSLAVSLDLSLGAIVQSVTALVVMWMIVIPLATTMLEQPTDWVCESKSMNLIDQAVPDGQNNDFNDILRQPCDDGMPAIAPSFGYKQDVLDESADLNVISQGVVDSIRPFIVHVLREAPQYERSLQGTGSVIAPDLILTNAHVVAGTVTVRLETVVDMVDTNVVHYDPFGDVALPRTIDLSLKLMQWADQEACLGDNAVVLGFPESESFKAMPTRATESIIIRGPDIYPSTRHERQSYVLKVDVCHGNSGGPLIMLQGQILDLIFSAGVNNDQTGYVLIRTEVQPHTDEMMDNYEAISTQEHVAEQEPGSPCFFKLESEFLSETLGGQLIHIRGYFDCSQGPV